MSKYLKMSDAFKGTVKPNVMDNEALDELMHGDCGKFHLEDDGYWLATEESHMEYAAHAINHHDALVKENEKLRELLTKCRPYVKDESDWGDDLEVKLLEEISQALGEVK